MKTRIIHTEFWQDSVILYAPPESRHLFNYLLTCPHINLTGIFQLPDPILKVEFGYERSEMLGAIRYLEENKRVLFMNDWIVVVNAIKHNAYYKSPKNREAFKREIIKIPDVVKKHIEELLGICYVDNWVNDVDNLKSKNEPELTSYPHLDSSIDTSTNTTSYSDKE